MSLWNIPPSSPVHLALPLLSTFSPSLSPGAPTKAPAAPTFGTASNLFQVCSHPYQYYCSESFFFTSNDACFPSRRAPPSLPSPPRRRNLRPSHSPNPRPSLDPSPSPRRSPPSSPSPSQHYRSSHNHNRTRPRMVGPSPSTPAGMNYPRTSSSGSLPLSNASSRPARTCKPSSRPRSHLGHLRGGRTLIPTRGVLHLPRRRPCLRPRRRRLRLSRVVRRRWSRRRARWRRTRRGCKACCGPTTGPCDTWPSRCGAHWRRRRVRCGCRSGRGSGRTCTHTNSTEGTYRRYC